MKTSFVYAKPKSYLKLSQAIIGEMRYWNEIKEREAENRLKIANQFKN